MDRIYGEGFSENGKDGKVISHYTKKDGLPSNFVNALDEDDRGNIVIGTNSGLSIFNGKEFKNYDFSSGIGNGFITDVKAVGKKYMDRMWYVFWSWKLDDHWWRTFNFQWK